MNKIASFCINHTNLRPGLYVSRVDHNNCCSVTTFDLRFRFPNHEPVMDMPAIHTIEHLGATYLRSSNEKDLIVYFGPMGCRTGFYLLMFGQLKSEEIYDLIIEMCDYILDFTDEIPGAKASDCGNFLEHNLKTAQFYTKQYKEVLVKEKNFIYPNL